MHPSIAAIALLALFAPAVVAEEPVWHQDYDAARQEGRRREKPLFVVIGSGKHGWNQLCRDDELSRETKRLLAKHYICLYVDTEHIAGRRLASDFDISEGPGVIISDSSGDLQAFRHEGDLSNPAIRRYARRFADPERDVTATETDQREEVSYYPPAEDSAPSVPALQPVSFAPSFGGGSGGCSS